MSTELIVIFWALAVTGIAVTLIEMMFGRRKCGIPSIYVGSSLLLIGGLLYMTDAHLVLRHVPFIHTFQRLHFVREIIGFFCGAGKKSNELKRQASLGATRPFPNGPGCGSLRQRLTVGTRDAAPRR